MTSFVCCHSIKKQADSVLFFKERLLNNVLLRFISRRVRLKRRAYFAKYLLNSRSFLQNRFKTSFKLALTKIFFSRLNRLRLLQHTRRLS
jgi:hypothetical protein